MAPILLVEVTISKFLVQGVEAFTHIRPALATPVPADTAAVVEPSFKRSLFEFGIMGMQRIKLTATSRNVSLVSFIWT